MDNDTTTNVTNVTEIFNKNAGMVGDLGNVDLFAEPVVPPITTPAGEK